MTELINNDPMKLRQILKQSINFISKNILWISMFGFLLAFLELFSQEFTAQFEANEYLQFIKYKLLFVMPGMIIQPFLIGSVALFIGEQLLGKEINWQQALRKTTKKWIPLVLLQAVIVIGIILGFILLAIPGMIVFCATACALPAMVIEDLGPIKAFKRSWNLTKGSRLRIFGYTALTSLITLAAAIIVIACFSILDINPYYQITASALIIAPLQGLWPAVSTLLYFDLRNQKEANTTPIEPEKA